MSAKLHCVVISWGNYFEQSAQISSAIAEHVDNLTVVYSNGSESEEYGSGSWFGVPNDWFYGRKFEQALKQIATDETMFLIHADTHCDDWPALARRCRTVLDSNPDIGVWAPAISKTPWTDVRVKVGSLEDYSINFVAQTDGVVFAYTPVVLDRLRKLDYGENNIGWGIDWIAICHSYVSNLFVISDQEVIIDHEEGQGYPRDEALAQMNLFLEQMTPQESLMYVILNSYCHPKVAVSRTEVLELGGRTVNKFGKRDSTQ